MNLKKIILIVTVIILAGSYCSNTSPQFNDQVVIDFDMVEQGVEWLDLINSSAPDAEIKAYFMQHVAPTKGCQAIIHHWARFRKWDAEELYKFIMTALGRIPSDQAIVKEDGALTYFGMRRKLWQNALADTDKMRRDLQDLKNTDLDGSIKTARLFLPFDAVLDVQFSFVLFGASNAFSVGKENGFDFLQLSRNQNGTIDTEQIINIFAHELHHSGFQSLAERNLQDIANEDRLLLVGILSAEGMPTYFIDNIPEHLEEYRNHSQFIYRQVAEDWENHSENMQALYLQAQTDISSNLNGELSQEDIMRSWMAGAKGPAYILGSDIISVIDTYLGREAAISVASDYRKLLYLYNQAADKAAAQGKEIFRFEKDLADRIASF